MRRTGNSLSSDGAGDRSDGLGSQPVHATVRAGRPASKESRGPIGRRDRPRTSSPGERSRSALSGMESLIQLPDRRGRGSRTGTRRDRPGLREALAACRAGDSLVVTKLDRVARSLPDARDIAEDLTRREVRLSLGGSGPGAVSEPQRRDHARRDDARWARSQGGTDQGLMEFATGLVAQSPP